MLFGRSREQRRHSTGHSTWMGSSSLMGSSPYASSTCAIAGSSKSGRGSVVDETKRGVIHRHTRKHNHAIHSSRSTACLLVLLALSCCVYPRSMTVEAFVGLTAVTTSDTRHVGFRCTSDGLTARSTASPERRSRVSPSLPRSRSSLPLRSVAPAAAAASSAASSSSPPSSAADGGSVVAEAGEEESADDDKKKRIRVNTLAEMTELLSQGASLFDLDARGDSQEMLEARQDDHPVLETLKRRAAAGTKPGSHGDGLKVSQLSLLPCAVTAVTTYTILLHASRIIVCCTLWFFPCACCLLCFIQPSTHSDRS